MKSRVEGMRTLLYFTGLCIDKAGAAAGTDETAEWEALRNMLMPLCRVFTAEAAFRVCETAIQVHGRFGYLKGSPVEQFIRDVKVQSVWELTTGLHALMFVAQTMPANDGRDFAALLSRMNQTIDAFEKTSGIEDLAIDVKSSVALLGGIGMFSPNADRGGMLSHRFQCHAVYAPDGPCVSRMVSSLAGRDRGRQTRRHCQ